MVGHSFGQNLNATDHGRPPPHLPTKTRTSPPQLLACLRFGSWPTSVSMGGSVPTGQRDHRTHRTSAAGHAPWTGGGLSLWTQRMQTRSVERGRSCPNRGGSSSTSDFKPQQEWKIWGHARCPHYEKHTPLGMYAQNSCLFLVFFSHEASHITTHGP